MAIVDNPEFSREAAVLMGSPHLLAAHYTLRYRLVDAFERAGSFDALPPWAQREVEKARESLEDVD